MFGEIGDSDGMKKTFRLRAHSDTETSLFHSFENLAIKAVREVAFPQLTHIQKALKETKAENHRNCECKKCEITKITVIKTVRKRAPPTADEKRHEDILPDFKLMDFARVICNPAC